MRKLKDWHPVVNDLCDFIVGTERELQDTFHLMPAEHGALSWRICEKCDKFRIFCGDKPFAESSVRARIQHSGDIAGLIEACEEAMEVVEASMSTGPTAMEVVKAWENFTGERTSQDRSAE